MRSTIIQMDNPNPELRGKPQSMVFEAGHPQAGQLEGMRVVLEERGLLGTLELGRNGQPVGTCSECRKTDEARAKAEKEALERMEQDPELYRSFLDTGLDEELPQFQARPANCCMLRCLSLQQDFLDEKPRIQHIIEDAGHICMFLPKFHCELNPIEMYWGYAKQRECALKVLC
ncbi:DDE family endonuclease [Ceratobasidium sp. AG-Ba]|nr:DDE family endonuclease [Ceratobasidium sp. AG-Ba]